MSNQELKDKIIERLTRSAEHEQIILKDIHAKLERKDWHGASDGCSDARDLYAEREGLHWALALLGFGLA